MSKFKVGDRVKRVSLNKLIRDSFNGMRIDDEDVVTGIAGDRSISLKNYGAGHSVDYFELVEDKSKHHKHHDLIIAWAKGAEIEYYSTIFNCWEEISKINWLDNYEYRIKPPAPKTDKERIAELEARVKELEAKDNG